MAEDAANFLPHGSILDRSWNPISLQLGLNAGDVVPEDDDVVLLAIDIANLVAQQALGAKIEALEQRHRPALVHRHLDGELLQTCLEGKRESLLRQCPPDPLPPCTGR